MTIACPESVEITDLDALRGEDESRAKEAFDRLWARARPAVLRVIARQNFVGAEAADVAQDAALRLWRRRRDLRAEALSGWIVLACRTGQRLALNRLARGRAFESLPDEYESSLPGSAFLDAILDEEDRSRAYAAADRLWLGVPVSVEADEVPIASAALRLVLAQGIDGARAATMFGHRGTSLDRWLDDPALVARAAFGALCWPGVDLAAHVLRLGDPRRHSDLDAALAGLGSFEGWSPSEAQAVCLREIHGMGAEAIARLVPALGSSEAQATISRSVQRYPFREQARDFVSVLGAKRLPGVGLWKRVALEYAAQGLGRDHLLQRAAPPAGEMGIALTPTTLDNWLGHGRLLEGLAAEIRREPQ